MPTRQVTSKKQNLDSAYFHGYDKTLQRLYKRIENEMSPQNCKTVKDYDIEFR